MLGPTCFKTCVAEIRRVPSDDTNNEEPEDIADGRDLLNGYFRLRHPTAETEMAVAAQ